MKAFVSIPKDNVPTSVYNTFILDSVKAYYAEKFSQVVYSECEGRQVTPEEFKAAVQDCEVVITGWGHPMITAEMVEGTKLKYIAHTGGTVGTLVAPEVYDMGIRVVSGNTVFAESVAEGTIAYMMTALRRIPDYINSVRNGGWRINYETRGMFNKTLGIVSLGAISRYVIDMVKPFNMNIKIYSGHTIDAEYLKEHNAEQVSLDELFETCDIVSVHSAMTEKTKGMIGKKQFDLLKDGAIFINTSRGRVIVEEELIAALKENRFSAVIDVFYNEPLEENSELRTLENVYCVPHMAGPTIDRRPAISVRIADAVCNLENGLEDKCEISKAAASRMTT